MNRRLILLMVLVAYILSIPNPICAMDPRTEKPMNVLFLIVDDLNSWLLEDPTRYAGKVVAPNIKALAESGVVFSRTYAASTVCTPSRTAVLSGVAPWRSGVYGNGYNTDNSPLIKESVSLPELFKMAGYYTAGAGKISHGYNIDDSAWDEKMRQAGDPTPAGAPLNGWAISAKGKVTIQDWGPIDVPDEDIMDYQYAEFAIQQLKKEHEKPFFITCGLFRPHLPWYVPQAYFDLYPLDEIVIPETMEDDLNDIPELGRKLVNSDLMKTILEHDDHKEGIQAYLACTSFSDRQIGRVMKALDNSPYKDNTIVVLWSDHGWHLGEKGHWTKGTLWEESARCLMMFRVPGMTKPGGKSERFVSLLDLYPTLSELTGLELPEGQIDGISLLPLLKDPDAPSEPRARTAYNNHMSIRTDQYRYIRYTDGSEEFYNCIEDPHEWNNLTADPDYRKAMNKVRKMVPALDEMTPEVGKKGKN
jgi:choline-sulfatase